MTIATAVMYHVAPRKYRESILAHGLDHGRAEGKTTFYTGGDAQGNYLFGSHASAKRFACNSFGAPGADVFAIDVADLDVRPDPRAHDAHFITQPIEVERISLHGGWSAMFNDYTRF